MLRATSRIPSRLLPVNPFFRSQSDGLFRSSPSSLLRFVFLGSFGLLIHTGLVAGARAQGTPVVALSPGLLTIVAGSGAPGYTGDNGPAVAATLNTNFGVAVDPSGDLYIADQANEVIRKVNAATGTITTVAGNGIQGYTGDDGPAVQAELFFPSSVAFDSAGNLYIAELYGGSIRKVTPDGIISTAVGISGGGYSGDGGPAIAAGLNRPYAVRVDSSNNLYIADNGNNVIRRVDARTHVITTVAGNGYGSTAPLNGYCEYPGYANVGGYTGDGGLAIDAELYGPRDIAIDSAGDLYIADSCNNVVRKVSASTGIITTVAGTGFGAGGPFGSGGFTGDGGIATAAELNLPESILLDPAGDLYIADSENYRLRVVNPAQIITTIAGNGASTASINDVSATSTGMHLEALAFDSSYNLFISDAHADQVMKIDVSQGALNFPTPTAPGTFDFNDGYEGLTLTNIGTIPFLGHRVEVTSSFLYDVRRSPGCPTLAPGASCPIPFSFLPLGTANGLVTGTATIAESGGTGRATQTVQLTGTATITPNFYLKSYPAQLTITPGVATYVLIEDVPLNGFAETIQLSASNVPQGARVAFYGADLTGSKGASIGIIKFPAGIAPGGYPIVITGTSGALTNSVTVTVEVPK